MKKRLLALLVLALVMVLALASCGDPIGDWLNPTPEEYTVYFLAGDGVSVPAQTVMEGELVTKPSDPKLLNYKFDGWFKDRECTTPWNFDTDKVERNTIIYAKWVECTHSGGEATCTKGAVCEICGATYTEPLGHKGGEANCTDGAICEVCGQTYTNPLGHKGGEATCEDAAVCEVCGKEYGEALGHLPGEAVKENEVAPTCTEAGSYDAVVYCEDCGEEVSRETVTVEALGHTEAIDEAVEPTCTEAGLTEGKHCSVCGEVLVAQEEVEATGHIPGAAVKENEVKGDCLTASSNDTVFYCSVCEIELQRDTTTVPAPGHKDNDNDDYCDACGDYLKTLTNVHINISNLTSITDNTELVPGTGISATTRLTLEGHNKDMGCSAFSMRLKLNGTMSVIDGAVDRGIKIVTNGPATIVVYAISGSKDATRTLRLVTLEEDTLVDVAIDEGVIGTDIGRYEFAVTEEGTYYLGSKSSGINLYYIAILYTAEENPHQCNNLCEICGKCLNEACTDELCADKCQGHHECEHVCEECGKCTDTACTEDVCADKCQGHAPAHVCESPCEICGKCTDNCEDPGCASKCQGHEEDDSVHVLDVTTDLAEMAQGAKTDGETEVIGGYFTIHYSAKTKIDGSSKTWEDGYSATQRINWGGTSSVKPGNIKNAIEFVVTGKTTVKIWWVSGGDGRTVDIVGIDGTVYSSVGSDSVKNTQYYNEITLNDAGTYYIAGLAGSNYIFKVEVAPYVEPAHECEHKCEECGKCTDECEEEACAEKCEGHVPPVDLTPVVGEYLKYDGNDCYTFDKESYLEEITFTYENVSTNTYQNVNTWIKDKAAGKATLDLYIVNNGTETVYVTVKLEAAGAVALAEEKVYVAAGEVASVTLNFTGEAEMLYFFIDTGWSENTTSHSGSITVAGVRFSEKSSDEPTPSYEYTDLYVEFKTENNYTITTTDTYVNSARISYADMAKNSWSNINIWIADKSAGCSVFSMKLTNHGAKTVSVWVQMKDANGVELINENVNIAAGTEETFVFEYTGEGQMIFFFVDSTHMAAEELNSGDITISEIKLGKVPAVEEPAHECEHKCEECGKCTDAECEEEVCLDKCLGHTKYTLDATADLKAAAQGDKANGQMQVVDSFFIIHYSESTKIDGSKKTFSDGYTATQRLNWGAATTMDPLTNAIEFKVVAGAQITIWWVSGGDGRRIEVVDANGTAYGSDGSSSIKNNLYISKYAVENAGTYYIVVPDGSNYIFKVEINTAPTEPVPHICECVCKECGKCLDAECREADCLDKCAGHHKCETICDKCGKCADLECTEEVCADKCQGHAPAHTECESVCPECGKCTDAECEEEVCLDKCLCNAPEMEEVYYEVDISNLATGTSSTDIITSKFTIVSGTEIRNRTKTWTDPEDSSNTKEFTKSVKIGSSSAAIKVSVPGTGKLTFYVQNGSSGADMQFVKIIAPNGAESQIEFVGNASGSPVVKIVVDVTEGEWTIQRVSGTIDIFALELACSVPVSDETGFEIVTPGKVDYVAGEKLDLSGIVLNTTYASGKTEPLALADVTVDASAYNKDVAGSYTITISYKEYESLTYTVNVYAPSSIRLDYDAVEKTGQTAYGNGLYFNHSFKEVYDVNEELATAGLSVTVICTHPAGGTKEFRVELGDVTITGFNSAVAGKQTLTAAYGDITNTVDVYVVDTAPSEVNGVYQAKVEKSYDGAIGAVVDGYNMFTTIQQALDYLARVDAGAQKLLVIGEGRFEEKLEITIPNLTIRGAGKDKTVIEWDSLYGIVDAGGFTHTTDSTQTVAVRDTAPGCTITDLTISNKYNSKEYFDQTMGENYSEHRALALLVQGDRFIMKDAALLGYQDTVEFFTGRQYLYNVYIQGLTDFIFGTNNTTLFENCEIRSINVGKTDGGYITAFKGMNKGSADAVQYGAIFYKCQFTADEQTIANGNTAIGRPWGAYAAVAVIECEIAGHVSTKGASGASKNERYVSMSGVLPTDSTVKFVEYGNTGAGAITEAVAGMRMLTAEEAALYHDIATIFGKLNGGVGYLDSWDPHSTEIEVDDREYYYFDQGSSATGTSHTFDTTTTIAKGGTLDWNGLHISAENGNVAWNQNANALNMKTGAFIRFTVPAGSLVTVTAYTGYNHFTLNGVGTSNSSILSQYYAEETVVTLMSIGDGYLYSIIINPNEEATEEAPTLSEIKVEGMNPNYKVGEELSYEGIVVKAIYSDSSIVYLTAADCAIDTSAVDASAAGEYVVVFTYGGKSASVTVNYEDPDAAAEITKNTTLSFKSEADYAIVANNKRVTMEGSFRFNGGEYQIQGTISFPVKAGTAIVVNPYNNSQYVSYTIGAEGEANLATLNSMHIYVAKEDCTVVYTGLSNNYLVSIDIICPSANTTYVFGSAAISGDFTGVLSSAGNLIVEGKNMRDNGDSAQMYQENKIKFAVPCNSTVTITGHSKGYGQLTVLVNGNLYNVESDENGVYVVEVAEGGLVTILPKNVGTEESPAYNKSYIKAIKVVTKVVISNETTINFGSEGNYKNVEGLEISDMSGIRDNGGNNTQFSKGSMSFIVKAGATVKVHGYPGYTSYKINGGDTITDEYYTYVAAADETIVITPDNGDNYFYSIEITYPAPEVPEEPEVPAHECEHKCEDCGFCTDTCEEEVCAEKCQGHEAIFSSSTTIDLSATNGVKIEGKSGIYAGLVIDATNGKFADNGSGWVQINTGTVISFKVEGYAEVSVTAYSSADNFTIVVADGVCTITATANDYLKAISIKITHVYAEPTTIDLSATGGVKIEGGTGTYEGLEIDATNGKFADNGSGWVQVNTGTVIRLNVFEGAAVSVTAYSSADNFTIVVADGVCTITATANDYLSQIKVEYIAVEEPETPEEPEHSCESVCAECGKCLDAECAEEVCKAKCAGHEVAPEEVTYVLDATADLDAMTAGAKADGDTKVIGGFFTIYYSAKTKIDGSNKTFADGYSATQRINWGGKSAVGSTIKNAIMFKTVANAKITIWWVSGGDGRTLEIVDADKNSYGSVGSDSVKNELYINEFTVDEAGTYFIISPVDSNYIFKVEVTTAEVEPIIPPHECESKCAECGLCLDAECAEEACVGKCAGHVVPEHSCESVCAECGKCLDAECAEEACKAKCAGHEGAPAVEPIVNVSDLAVGSTTAGAELIAGTGISTTTSLAIDSNTKKIDGFEFTLRLKLGGTMKTSDGVVSAGVKIVTTGAAKIVVYGMSSSSSATRTLRLTTLENGALVDVAINDQVAGDAIGKYVFEVPEAGTYYLGSLKDGINLYYIAVVYDAE